MGIDVKGLRRIRNYFGEHDKTIFEHHAYAFLDRIIKDIENPTPDKAKMTGVELIAKERGEQIEKHGWDDKDNKSLPDAVKYCIDSIFQPRDIVYPPNWDRWFGEKIKEKRNRMSFKDFRIEMMKTAGAFCAAEIDRLQAINQQQEEQP